MCVFALNSRFCITYRWSFLMIVMIILVACRPVESTPSPTGAMVSPSPTTTSALTPSPIQTPTPQTFFDRRLLLQVCCDRTGEQELYAIYSLAQPYQHVKPMYESDTFSYDILEWSKDGNRFLLVPYQKKGSPEPELVQASLWASKSDGSDHSALIEESTSGIGPAHWSPDQNKIVYLASDWKILDLQTGEMRPLLPKQELQEAGFDTGEESQIHLLTISPSTDGILAAGYDFIGQDPVILFLTGFSNPDEAKIIPFRAEFTNREQRYFGDEFAWSPDGKYIVVSDADPNGTKTRLWRINLSTLEWEIVAHFSKGINLFKEIARHKEFSPDGRWLAMWFSEGDYSNPTRPVTLHLIFVDTQTWQTTRLLTLPHMRWSSGAIPDGWIIDTSGQPYFTYLDDTGTPDTLTGKGVILLHPSDESRDYPLINLKDLMAGIPPGRIVNLAGWQP